MDKKEKVELNYNFIFRNFDGEKNKREICSVSGKICYSLRDARTIIKNCKKRKKKTKNIIPSREYFCKDCGSYHLTHYKKMKRSNKEYGSKKNVRKFSCND